MNMHKVCNVVGCGEPAIARGLCSHHYTMEPSLRAARIHRQHAYRQHLLSLNLVCGEPGCKRPATRRIVDSVPTRCGYHDQPHGVLRQRQNAWQQKRRAEFRQHHHPCIIAHCPKPAMRVIADDIPTLCDSHYRCTQPSSVSGDLSFRQRLGNRCAVCGYDRLAPHAHRIERKGPYVPTNCIPLCSNCHREVHEGGVSDVELLKYQAAWLVVSGSASL